METIWAAVAFKGLAAPKRRLSPLLTLDERRGLSRAMLADVIAALKGTAGIGRLLVVSRDPSALDLAVQLGAEPLEERGPTGYRAAAEQAAGAAAAAGASGLLLCAADLPLLTSDDVECLLNQSERAAIVLAPSLDERGTNAVLARPPGALRYRFGRESLAAHLREARQAGFPVSVLKRPNLGLDVDQPTDLQLILDRDDVPSGNASCRYLDEIRLAQRLPD